MKWKKLFTGAGALAVCALFAKLLGAFYRIPLTNITGAEGMGLYQMVFPLYTVLLTVSSGGLTSAISKVVAGALAKNDERGALRVLRTALVSLVIVGAVCTVFLIFFRGRIATLQGNGFASLAYLGIAPAVVLVAVISCFRGYFQGRGNMLPSGISQIIEQLFKLAFGLYFAALLLPRGVEYAVLGAALGITLSELASAVVLVGQFLVFYHRQKKRRFAKVKTLLPTTKLIPQTPLLQNLNFEAGEDIASANPNKSLQNKGGIAAYPSQKQTTSEILKKLYKIAIPVTLGSLIMPLTQVIDSVMVINVLVAGGVERGVATSLFGLVSGPINSLVNMPVAVTLSISVALLPKIAFIREKGGDAGQTAANALRLALLLILPAAALLMFFPRQIVTALYSRGLNYSQLKTATSLLRIESLSVLYIGIIQICTAVLQGADKPHRPAINLLFGALVKVMLTLVLLPFLGIRGAAAASVMCYAVIAAIDLFYAQKALRGLKRNLNFVKHLLLPVVACVVLVLVGFGLLHLFEVLPIELSTRIKNIAALAIAAACYALFLQISKAVTIKELFK